METDVQLSHDGRKMYISSDRRFSWGGLDIWCSDWNDTTQNWGEPINLGFGLNMDSDDETPCPSVDGNTLYFASWGTHGFPSPPWMGPVDIFVAHYDGRNWDNLEIIPPPIATTYWDYGPAISNDGLTLYFSSTRPGGPGAPDIFVSHYISAIDEHFDETKRGTKYDINIYPNPANGFVTFNLNGPHNGIKQQLFIYDINGSMVMHFSITNQNDVIWNGRNLKGREVSSGYYIAIYEQNMHRAIKKFLFLK
jgi:hypothetical protein